MAGYILDTGVVSSIRNSGVSPQEWVGDPDLAVTPTIVDELFVDLASSDIQAVGNARVLGQLPDPLPESEDVFRRAEDLQQRFATHQPPLTPHDALIAAAALVYERVLITKDRKGFHFITGLQTVDAADFRPTAGPILTVRGAVSGGPIGRQCCSKVK